MRMYGIIFILAGIIMLVITVVQLLKLLSFRNCDVTTATVTGVDSRKHYTKGRSSTTFSQKLTYNVDGVTYERSIPCDADDYRMGANRQIEIRYKSRNPKRIMANNAEKQSRGQKILWIITLALLAIGALLLLVL